MCRTARRTTLLMLIGLVASLPGFAQEPAPTAGKTVIKTETREVLVDTIVTDKHGQYVKDLTSKDFRVWEDNKEQKIKSFTYAADPESPAARQKHYLVLFFDNSSMDFADQGRARIAAAQFIDANAGANQYMAIANFGGELQIAQNFTQDSARLKALVTGMKFSSVSPNDLPVSSFAGPVNLSSGAQFGVRSVLLALRSLAKSLQPIPGRKSLVFLSSGFLVTPEVEWDATAAVDACNKANVAIYPIDVRGLTTGMAQVAQPKLFAPATLVKTGRTTSLQAVTAADLHWTGNRMPANGGAHLVYVQRAGGQTGGGAPRTGGGTPTTPRPSGGNPAPRPVPSANNSRTPTGTPRIVAPTPIIPPLLLSAGANQQILQQLANGTGGFVIINSNDLLGGMQKISDEQSQYYILGYEPANADDGSCHTLKVKVDRNNTMVRSRSGYCNVRPADVLAGKPMEKELESRANGTQTGVAASMMPSFFYTSADSARVDLAIDMPADAIKFDKDKGKYQAEVNVLGIAYKPDGSVAAKFSDTTTLEFAEKNQLEEFQKLPYHYENQFDIACGTYTLKVAFTSGGESFGKLEAPLVIDPYDSKHFTVSGLVLSRQMIKLTDVNADVQSELIEDRKPLIYDGFELVPAGAYRFKKSDKLGAYVELYDPLLVHDNPPKLTLKLVVLDLKTSKPAITAAVTDTSKGIKAGSPVVPLALRIPLEKLNAGSYRLEVQGVDSAGNMTRVRTADFELE